MYQFFRQRINLKTWKHGYAIIKAKHTVQENPINQGQGNLMSVKLTCRYSCIKSGLLVVGE